MEICLIKLILRAYPLLIFKKNNSFCSALKLVICTSRLEVLCQDIRNISTKDTESVRDDVEIQEA